MTPSEINRDLPEGATPLDPDEAEDLLPSHIRTRGELNVWEQENILVAAAWVQRARAEALDEATIRELHRRMFSETWGWAGRYRTSDKTIGIHWPQIPVAVRNFVEDGRLWLREEVFPPDEAALRLHHRLVQIHPFPNGNGRHATLVHGSRFGCMIGLNCPRPGAITDEVSEAEPVQVHEVPISDTELA